MANVKPFQCIRPVENLVSRIAALPYDVYNREEACAVVKNEPLSFLRIDRAETQFDEQVGIYDDCVYQKAHELLWGMVQKGEFVRESEAYYFIYELTMDGRAQKGIVACASIDDYLNNIIKKHENTREEKEQDRIRHVDVCNAQTGPIFLAYRAKAVINEIVDRTKQTAPLYDFTAEDGITHRVWKITKPEQIMAIQTAFGELEDIYIADGHHRAASAVKVGLKRRAEHPDYDGSEEFNYFLSVLFPDEQLMIMDYNRVVKDLNGMSTSAFLESVAEKFDIAPGSRTKKPARKGEVAMYLDGAWYLLTVKPEYTSKDPVEGLDVSILQDQLLRPVLGIEDPKTDSRIDFVGGIRGYGGLEQRVHEDCAVAFAMYPTSIAELFAVSDANRLMPPKSTWFEPKLRSGLFIHELD